MASFPLLACMSVRTNLLRERFPDGDDLSEVFGDFSERLSTWFQKQVAGSGMISQEQAESLIATLGPDGKYIATVAYRQIIEAVKSKSPKFHSGLLGEPQLSTLFAALPQQHDAPGPVNVATGIQSHSTNKQVNFYFHNYLTMSMWQGLRSECAIKAVLFMLIAKFMVAMGMVNVNEMQWPYLEAMVRWAARIDVGNQLDNVQLLKMNFKAAKDAMKGPCATGISAPLVYPEDPLALRSSRPMLFNQLYPVAESMPQGPPAELTLNDLRFLQKITPARRPKDSGGVNLGQMLPHNVAKPA